MALASNEKWIGGFIRDTSNSNALVVTTDTTGAADRGGFFRDPDGRLVITINA
jgi:hypothetical protein